MPPNNRTCSCVAVPTSERTTPTDPSARTYPRAFSVLAPLGDVNPAPASSRAIVYSLSPSTAVL